MGSTPVPTPAPAPRSQILTLDGSRGEGGGQILRSALTLSMLTGRPFRIARIRANRDKPGLRPQHLTAVEAAATLCGGEIVGGKVGATDLIFRPGAVSPRDLAIDIGTAGATALVLQTIALPLALRSPTAVRVTLKGGTYNTAAPSYPFLEATWRPAMASLGLPIGLAMPLAGYFPLGGGRLEAWIEPARLRPLVLEDRGRLRAIRGIAETTGLDPAIGVRMGDSARRSLTGLGWEAQIDHVDRPGPGRGAALSLTAEFDQGPPATYVGLGQRGKPAEAVASDAVDQLTAHLEATHGALDLHSADQVLLPLAFAQGSSVFTVTEITEHLRTNVVTIGAFLARPIRIEQFPNTTGGRVIIK